VADGKARWVVTAPGSEGYSTTAGRPRRSRRHLVAISIVLAVGAVGTIMAQRARPSRTDFDAVASPRTAPSGRAQGETLPAFAAEPAPTAAVQEARDGVTGTAAAAPVEPSHAARGATEAPAKTVRRAIRQKVAPPSSLSTAAASATAVEAPSATTTLSRPLLDPLEGRH
jgi:hypothetical protein